MKLNRYAIISIILTVLVFGFICYASYEIYQHETQKTEFKKHHLLD